MATTKSGKTAGRVASTAQIKKLIGKSFETNDENVANGISRALQEMGINLPQPVASVTAGSKVGKSPRRLSQAEIVLMTLLSNPNEWFLVLTGKNRRRDVGIYGLGDCFEMTTRRVDGLVQHYARYNGGKLNALGKKKVDRIRNKMSAIRTSVAGGAITLSTRSSRKKAVKKGSLTHAAMYALSAEEVIFLDKVITNPNREILVLSGTPQNETWHSFRWKWEARYGFDLSEISISQRKMEKGRYNIYVTYTPKQAGIMSEAMGDFVSFLEQKRVKHGKKSVKTGTPSEGSVIGWLEPIKHENSPVIIPVK